MRGQYTVTGRRRAREHQFTAPGAAETFRGITRLRYICLLTPLASSAARDLALRRRRRVERCSSVSSSGSCACSAFQPRAMLRRDGLAPRDLHPEAIEAERPRPHGCGVVAAFAEAVAGLARRQPAHIGACRSVIGSTAGRAIALRPAIQGKLTLVSSQCLGMVLPSELLPTSRAPTPNAVMDWVWATRELGATEREYERQGKTGQRGKEARRRRQVDALLPAPAPEFIAARNALATQLKKAGHAGDADAVKRCRNRQFRVGGQSALLESSARLRRLLANRRAIPPLAGRAPRRQSRRHPRSR